MTTDQLQASLASIFDETSPPDLGPGPRARTASETQLNQQLDAALPESGLDREKQDLIRALALLWHDHLEASHRISQDIAGIDGSYVHGIMHRREPDYSNAKYWFRRAGIHPSFSHLANNVADYLKGTNHPDVESRLMPSGDWDAFAFVDFCEEGATGSEDAQAECAKAIQVVEFKTLLDYLTR